MLDEADAEVLLCPANDPLRRLTLERLRLGRASPPLGIVGGGDELLLYGLLGDVAVTAEAHEAHDGPSVEAKLRLTRRRVDAVGSAALRLPAGPDWRLEVRALERAADYLLVRASTAAEAGTTPTPLVHRPGSAEVYQVGEGAHAREVRVFPTPPGYGLCCGETLNPPGHWSSWPSHFPEGTLQRYAEWEELMYVITPGWGLVCLDGRYVTGDAVHEVRRLSNGDAFVAPLGAHPIIASPQAWLLYVWVYAGSVLRKAYPQWATDVTSVYTDEVL